MNFKRVVITGLGTINPLGHNVAEFWENLKGGVSGAGPITRFDASKFRTQFACEVKNYEPTEYFDKKEVRKMDLYSQFALICSREAVKDAGLDFSQEDRKRIGVIWGAGIGGLDTFYEECKTFALGDGTPRFNPFFIPKMIANMGGAMIAIEEGLKGPNYTTVSACASSAHSLVDALNLIRLGKADVILAGGSEAAITPPGVGGFNSMKALSTRNDDPKTASRPFDADRDGFVIGEGGACLVVEEYEHAVKRGAHIYAELAGGGANCDAYHMTAPDPEGEGAADEEAHIALLPVVRGVGQLLGEHTVLIHAVPGDVRADVAPLAHVVGQGLLPPDDLQNGAGEGVSLGVFLEVGGILRGQDDQIGLGIAPAHPGGGKVDPALPDQLADLRRLFVDIGGNVKCHTDIPPDRL